MWFTKLAVSTLCLAVLAPAAVSTPTDHSIEQNKKRGGGDFKALGCPNTTKPCATYQDQLHAVTSYYDLLFSGNYITGFNTWTAKNFIQHAPDATGDGIAAAEQAVGSRIGASKESILNIFVGKNASGTDFAFVYFKAVAGPVTLAVMETWRFAGDCLVEHWDVVQQASGQNFSNPKAFF